MLWIEHAHNFVSFTRGYCCAIEEVAVLHVLLGLKRKVGKWLFHLLKFIELVKIWRRQIVLSFMVWWKVYHLLSSITHWLKIVDNKYFETSKHKQATQTTVTLHQKEGFHIADKFHMVNSEHYIEHGILCRVMTIFTYFYVKKKKKIGLRQAIGFEPARAIASTWKTLSLTNRPSG